MTLFRVSIVTQEKVFLDADIVSLVIPGGLGYLGVLAHHAPLLTVITKGRLTLTLPDKSQKIYDVDGGFMEVAKNVATILPDSIVEVA